MLAINAFRQDAWTRQDPRLPNANGRIVFAPSKGLPCVGLHRASYALTTPEDTKEGVALAREHVRGLEGTITRDVTDDTHLGGPFERQMVYCAPFDSRPRQADYSWPATLHD